VGLFFLAKLPINPSSLNFFYVILALGLAVPGIAAQIWRSKSPVDSNRHSKNWKFIGVFAVALMALATGFQFTPPQFFSDVFSTTSPERSLVCLQQLGIAVLIFALLRLFAVLTLTLSRKLIDKAEAKDAYILLVTPNFFLWAALFGAVNVVTNQDALKYAAFWGACGFFCIPVAEQILFMNAFTSDVLREALRSSRMAVDDIKKLFLKLDKDGSNSLEKAEIMELLGMIEDMTTGERTSEEVRRYITDYLFNTLDADQNGTIELAELEDYLSTYGMVANLNIVSTPATK
jgi:2,3-bisphosphoglycerate-dependent phosphoglycerate mutase